MKEIYKTIQQFLISIILLFAILLVLRIIEYLYLSNGYGSLLSSEVFFTGLKYDGHFVLFISIISLVFFSTNYFFKKDFILTIFKMLLTVILLIHFGLTQYFLTNKQLLGTSLFSFSAKDILLVASSELSISRIFFWSLYFFILIYFFLLNRLWEIREFNKTVTIFFLSTYLLFSIVVFSGSSILNSSPVNYDEEIQYHFASNKILYVVKNSADKYRHKKEYEKLSESDIAERIKNYQQSNSQFEYVSSEYPLLHKSKYKNVLGEFFPVSNKKPNIVLLIVEGLSSSFVGPNANVGNLMPFVDSLISKSLYWENFYSNAQGTFAALPSILSSLPNGYYERGFINIPYNYPEHSSIIEILNKNDYETTYYYGGDGYYDQTKKFLHYHEIDEIYDAKVLDSEYFSTVVSASWSSWGIDDLRLFQQAIKNDKGIKIREPYFKIYQTLSIHSPFNIVPPEYLYDETVRTRLAGLNLPNASRLKQKYKDAVGSIFLADDALKYFFKQNSKRSEFENTIFIITGDHSIKEFPFENDLQKYHIPLIIYSPMLKKTGEFNSIATHIDIAPSLLSLLKNNFQLNTPKIVHWLGQGLSTNNKGGSKYIADMATCYGSKIRALYGSKFIYDNKVYSILKGTQLKKADENKMIDNFLKEIKNFSLVWNYITIEDKIIKNKNGEGP